MRTGGKRMGIAAEARARGVDVISLGVGDPDTGRFRVANDEPFETRLQEEPLRQVAGERHCFDQVDRFQFEDDGVGGQGRAVAVRRGRERRTVRHEQVVLAEHALGEVAEQPPQLSGGDTPAHRRERNELVLSSRRRHEAAQRAEHVVADARSLVLQGRDVDDDPHCFGCT